MQVANKRYRSFNHANYEDPDINVAIPVFSIHGNHDDPSGVCQNQPSEAKLSRLTFARMAVLQPSICSKQLVWSTITDELQKQTTFKSSRYFYKRGTQSLLYMESAM